MKWPWSSRPQRRVKIQRSTTVVLAFQTTMAARPPDVQRHTGAEYEAGRVHRHLMNEEQPIGGMLRTGGGEPTAPGASPTRHRQQNAEQMDLGQGLGDCNSPAHSTRASVGEKSAEPSPRDVRAAARTAARHNEDDLVASLRKPWRGQANNLKGAQKKVLAQFEEVGVRKKKIEDGVQIDVAVTKFWVKWFDGWVNHQLALDNYVGGLTAPYKSWVLLQKQTVE